MSQGRFHELDGRRGYFLVVSLPHTENGHEYEGGFESDCLTPENADGEADFINGPKAIFWQFLDEQPKEVLGEAVRHYVGPVSFKPRDPTLIYLRGFRDEAWHTWATCQQWMEDEWGIKK